MPIVEFRDYEIEFPEDTPEDEILRVLQRNFPEAPELKQQPEPGIPPGYGERFTQFIRETVARPVPPPPEHEATVPVYSPFEQGREVAAPRASGVGSRQLRFGKPPERTAGQRFYDWLYERAKPLPPPGYGVEGEPLPERQMPTTGELAMLGLTGAALLGTSGLAAPAYAAARMTPRLVTKAPQLFELGLGRLGAGVVGAEAGAEAGRRVVGRAAEVRARGAEGAREVGEVVGRTLGSLTGFVKGARTVGPPRGFPQAVRVTGAEAPAEALAKLRRLLELPKDLPLSQVERAWARASARAAPEYQQELNALWAQAKTLREPVPTHPGRPTPAIERLEPPAARPRTKAYFGPDLYPKGEVSPFPQQRLPRTTRISDELKAAVWQGLTRFAGRRWDDAKNRYVLQPESDFHRFFAVNSEYTPDALEMVFGKDRATQLRQLGLLTETDWGAWQLNPDVFPEAYQWAASVAHRYRGPVIEAPPVRPERPIVRRAERPFVGRPEQPFGRRETVPFAPRVEAPLTGMEEIELGRLGVPITREVAPGELPHLGGLTQREQAKELSKLLPDGVEISTTQGEGWFIARWKPQDGTWDSEPFSYDTPLGAYESYVRREGEAVAAPAAPEAAPAPVAAEAGVKEPEVEAPEEPSVRSLDPREWRRMRRLERLGKPTQAETEELAALRERFAAAGRDIIARPRKPRPEGTEPLLTWIARTGGINWRASDLDPEPYMRKGKSVVKDLFTDNRNRVDEEIAEEAYELAYIPEPTGEALVKAMQTDLHMMLTGQRDKRVYGAAGQEAMAERQIRKWEAEARRVARAEREATQAEEKEGDVSFRPEEFEEPEELAAAPEIVGPSLRPSEMIQREIDALETQIYERSGRDWSAVEQEAERKGSDLKRLYDEREASDQVEWARVSAAIKDEAGGLPAEDLEKALSELGLSDNLLRATSAGFVFHNYANALRDFPLSDIYNLFRDPQVDEPARFKIDGIVDEPGTGRSLLVFRVEQEGERPLNSMALAKAQVIQSALARSANEFELNLEPFIGVVRGKVSMPWSPPEERAPEAPPVAPESAPALPAPEPQELAEAALPEEIKAPAVEPPRLERSPDEIRRVAQAHGLVILDEAHLRSTVQRLNREGANLDPQAPLEELMPAIQQAIEATGKVAPPAPEEGEAIEWLPERGVLPPAALEDLERPAELEPLTPQERTRLSELEALEDAGTITDEQTEELADLIVRDEPIDQIQTAVELPAAASVSESPLVRDIRERVGSRADLIARVKSWTPEEKAKVAGMFGMPETATVEGLTNALLALVFPRTGGVDVPSTMGRGVGHIRRWLGRTQETAARDPAALRTWSYFRQLDHEIGYRLGKRWRETFDGILDRHRIKSKSDLRDFINAADINQGLLRDYDKEARRFQAIQRLSAKEGRTVRESARRRFERYSQAKAAWDEITTRNPKITPAVAEYKKLTDQIYRRMVIHTMEMKGFDLPLPERRQFIDALMRRIPPEQTAPEVQEALEAWREQGLAGYVDGYVSHSPIRRTRITSQEELAAAKRDLARYQEERAAGVKHARSVDAHMRHLQFQIEAAEQLSRIVDDLRRHRMAKGKYFGAWDEHRLMSAPIVEQDPRAVVHWYINGIVQKMIRDKFLPYADKELRRVQNDTVRWWMEDWVDIVTGRKQVEHELHSAETLAGLNRLLKPLRVKVPPGQIRSMGDTWLSFRATAFVGANPRSVLLNAFQAPTLGIPFLGPQWFMAGWRANLEAALRPETPRGKSLNHLLADSGIQEAQAWREFLDYTQRGGVVEVLPKDAEAAAQMIERESLVREGWYYVRRGARRVGDLLWLPFDFVERNMNRRTVFLGQALKSLDMIGVKDVTKATRAQIDQAAKHGRMANDWVNFDYSLPARGRATQLPVFRQLAQFSTFMSNWVETQRALLFNERPDVFTELGIKNPRLVGAGMLGMMLLVGGAMAIPGYELARVTIHKGTGVDIEDETRRIVREQLGIDLPQYSLMGVVSKLAGLGQTGIEMGLAVNPVFLPWEVSQFFGALQFLMESSVSAWQGEYGEIKDHFRRLVTPALLRRLMQYAPYDLVEDLRERYPSIARELGQVTEEGLVIPPGRRRPIAELTPSQRLLEALGLARTAASRRYELLDRIDIAIRNEDWEQVERYVEEGRRAGLIISNEDVVRRAQRARREAVGYR